MKVKFRKNITSQVLRIKNMLCPQFNCITVFTDHKFIQYRILVWPILTYVSQILNAKTPTNRKKLRGTQNWIMSLEFNKHQNPNIWHCKASDTIRSSSTRSRLRKLSLENVMEVIAVKKFRMSNATGYLVYSTPATRDHHTATLSLTHTHRIEIYSGRRF